MKTISKTKKIVLVTLCFVIALILAILVVGVIILKSFTSPYPQKGVICDDAIVQTDKGKLQGRKNNGVYNFLGVEYARATKLFVRAEEIEEWSGVKKAVEYGPSCMQENILGNFGSWISGVKYDNDCQNLNIWTPENGKNLPVMVWLHGGGFSTGSAYASRDYNGENLAKKEKVVVVGVNHRLNVLGHLDLSAYGEEYRYSGNTGIDDIVKALKWIKTNISAFGGNPDNITLFGQSGGGAKILALMDTPYAKGLFHKAIIQSGATETVGVKFTAKEVATETARLTLESLGLSVDEVQKIQDADYKRLIQAGNSALSTVASQFKIPGPFGGYSTEWEPVVDGDYIPTDPVTDDSFAENGKDIPLLIGSNLFEWTKFVSSERLKVNDEIREAFKEAYPNKAPSDATYVDTLIRLPILKLTVKKAEQNGAKVFSYVYTYGNATHGAEIPYVFANGNGKMNEVMSSLWANFARNGIPSADGLPEWQPYTRERGECMIIDETSYTAYNHDEKLLKLVKPDYSY